MTFVKVLSCGYIKTFHLSSVCGKTCESSHFIYFHPYISVCHAISLFIEENVLPTILCLYVTYDHSYHITRQSRLPRAKTTCPEEWGGEKEGREEQRRQIIVYCCPLPRTLYRCMLRKFWQRGRWVSAHVRYTVVPALILPTYPSSYTHMHRLKCCAGHAATHTACFLYLGPDISPLDS